MSKFVIRLKTENPNKYWDEVVIPSTYTNMEQGKNVAQNAHRKLINKYKEKYICIRFILNTHNEYVFCNYRLPSWCE